MCQRCAAWNPRQSRWIQNRYHRLLLRVLEWTLHLETLVKKPPVSTKYFRSSGQHLRKTKKKERLSVITVPTSDNYLTRKGQFTATLRFLLSRYFIFYFTRVSFYFVVIGSGGTTRLITLRDAWRLILAIKFIHCRCDGRYKFEKGCRVISCCCALFLFLYLRYPSA